MIQARALGQASLTVCIQHGLAYQAPSHSRSCSSGNFRAGSDGSDGLASISANKLVMHMCGRNGTSICARRLLMRVIVVGLAPVTLML